VDWIVRRAHTPEPFDIHRAWSAGPRLLLRFASRLGTVSPDSDGRDRASSLLAPF
jgi:hypothetical protein